MRAMIPRPWVILLAAGGSRRFGGTKLLARIHDETLLHRSARIALGCRPAGCIVVLGANGARLRRELRNLPVEVVVNRRWRAGLSGSLRAGIAALPVAASAALVLLADQAGVGPADLELLVAAWQRAPRAIVTAHAAGVRCPPAILPRQVFPDVRRLRGDTGAKKLLADPRRRLVEFELPGAALDIDRPEDLARFAQYIN
jgi:molybdenum cofactor cytidylyltransferase